MRSIGLKHYQEKLSKRREDILASVRHLAAEDRELLGNKHLDWVDQAWDETELRLVARLSEGYQMELRKIDAALDRISSGKYGLCIACHTPMNRARLDTSPETEFCQECQELREKFEKAS